MNSLRHPLPRPVRAHGSVAVPFALILPVVLGMMGLAIDLSMLYLREAEMQQMADSTAMAAARRLDGTLAGIAAAKQDARDMAHRNYYAGIYSGSPTLFEDGSSWSSSAIFLSKAPSGQPWIPADSVTNAATAADMMYVKIDTRQLASLSANPGQVATTLMRFLKAPDTVTLAPVAVAGKTGMQITPLGVCALSTVKFAPRPSGSGNELLEYGYRRGVPYDLLNLSPSTPAAQKFVVNPIDGGDTGNPDPAHVTHDFIKPFFCSGSIAYASLRSGKSVYVAALPDVHDWLNSRFNDYTGDGDACTARNGAPPDTNVKEFTPSTVGWISTNRFSAKPYGTASSLLTIADPSTLPSNTEVKDYGPLWVNAKPVKFVSAAVGGGSPPTYFKLSDWPNLYPWNAGPNMVVPTFLNYKDPPYANYKVSPSAGISVAGRRMLNLPLLDCTGTVSGTATVLGVGKFLMISRAVAGSVYAEFEGLVDETTLISNVRRVQ